MWDCVSGDVLLLKLSDIKDDNGRKFDVNVKPVGGSGDFRDGRPGTVGRFVPLVAPIMTYKDGKRGLGPRENSGT